MNNTNKEGKRYVGILCIGIITVISIWICYLFAWQVLSLDCIRPYLPSIMLDAQGQLNLSAFGEYFGALNALFAGLAFAGLVVTIRQQSADLRATKREMQAQTHQFRKQNDQLLRQDFYSRIELLYKLEDKITCLGYEELEDAAEHFGAAKTGTEKQKEQQKLILFTTCSLDILQIFKLTENPELKLNELENVAEVLRTNAPNTWIWIKSIYDILKDIETDFEHQSDKQRMALMLLNSTRSMTLILVLLFRRNRLNVPAEVVERISAYIDNENFISAKENGNYITAEEIAESHGTDGKEIPYALHDPVVRELFVNIVLEHISVAEAAETWQNVLRARNQKAYRLATRLSDAEIELL